MEEQETMEIVKDEIMGIIGHEIRKIIDVEIKRAVDLLREISTYTHSLVDKYGNIRGEYPYTKDEIVEEFMSRF